MKKTKIVCTLGPSSSTPDILEEMIRAGMNVARLNFSHGTHEEHLKRLEMVRSVRQRMHVPLAILLDTKGPEIRLGDFQGDSVQLENGDHFTLTTEDCLGDKTHASITYKELPPQLRAGNHLLIDDGRVSMTVVRADAKEVECVIDVGGKISNHKGINVPSVHLEMPYLSEQDKSDLLFGIENDVDFIAASFARNREDMVELRKFLDYHGGHDIKIIAKIENLEGIEHFEEILSAVNGIMVARGDMGVEVGFELLPGIQKRFIKRCCEVGKIVITATQMLESMIQSANPTRAEITDVANAVFDGTSAVMLSGESAMGKYPVDVVRVMTRIVERAEQDMQTLKINPVDNHDIDYTDTTNAICDATCTTARDIRARAIIAVTKYGSTALRMSKFRPEEPIIAATPSEKTYNQLTLSWGVFPVLARYQTTTDELFTHAVDCAKMIDLVEDGDRVVITAGIPLGTSGNTNILKVQIVGQKN